MAKKSNKRVSKKSSKNPDKDSTLAIIALILNILILPGLGSIIGGKTKIGIWQIVLFVIGAILSLILIGIPILIAAWIWGIVTGVQLIKTAK